METIAEQKVGKIVAENFRTARVFTLHGIDFCCGGGIRLAEACEKKGLDLNLLSQELQEAMTWDEEVHFADFTLSQLIDHIIQVHHHYVEETLPLLKFYLEKIERVHGERHPELLEIKNEFFKAADALTVHMKKEEFILFPYIKAMENALEGNYPLSKPHFGSIENPIGMMEEDHDQEGERFKRIAELSNHFTPPADACQTYKVAFSMLQEFEEDLHTHIHLENNILFDKAIHLYQFLNS